MKNIFDYLITKENTLNEEVFESFADWIFEGGVSSNELPRTFLRWSVLYIMKDSGDRHPDNSDFFKFFQQFDRTDFDSFLNHILKYEDIAQQVEIELGNDQATRYSGDNQSTYWYFFGTIKKHIEENTLFPEQPETKKTILSFDKNRKPAETPEKTNNIPDLQEDPLSDKELKSVTNVFAVLLAILVVGFLFFNLFIKG
ncbi:hypothetical protein KJ966_11465 [bacterium]|nr:hypothetical protein [bacterium]